MEVKLRKARMEDWEILLKWRNDPSVFCNYLSPHPVDQEAHMRWFSVSLQSDTREIYIVEEGDVSVGMVRLDTNEEGHRELSWVIDPSHQGKGIGTALLRQVRKQFSGVLLAEILKENIASIKIAEAAGFILQKTSDGLSHYRSNS